MEIKAHTHLIDSGLAEALGITSDETAPNAELIGTKVRYKRGLDWSRYGTIARDTVFMIGHVQGESSFRIYSKNELRWAGTDHDYRVFGTVATMDELNIITEEEYDAFPLA